MEATDTQVTADRLLPFTQAQRLVGISRSQIYVLLEHGGFPAPTKIGRCNYFSERELRTWIGEKLAQRCGGTDNVR